MSDPKTFALRIGQWAERQKSKANTAVKLVVIELSTRITMRTPVGDPALWQSPPPAGYVGGRARGSFLYGAGSAPSGDPGTIDPSGQASIARVVQGIPDNTAIVHYVVSNLPYMQRLEDGWSTQAPSGMIGLVVQEFSAIVDKAAAEVRNT